MERSESLMFLGKTLGTLWNDESSVGKNQSLNLSREKYSIFYKRSKKKYILLHLLKLKIAHREMERSESLMFLGVLLNENRILEWILERMNKWILGKGHYIFKSNW